MLGRASGPSRKPFSPRRGLSLRNSYRRYRQCYRRPVRLRTLRVFATRRAVVTIVSLNLIDQTPNRSRNENATSFCHPSGSAIGESNQSWRLFGLDASAYTTHVCSTFKHTRPAVVGLKSYRSGGPHSRNECVHCTFLQSACQWSVSIKSQRSGGPILRNECVHCKFAYLAVFGK